MVLKGFLLAVLALCAGHVTALTLANSNWILKDSKFMSVGPYVIAGFRRHFTSLDGKQASSANILIAGDNNYTLYVNGEFIGQGNNWWISKKYSVRLNATNNLFAVAVEHKPYGPGNPSYPTPNHAAFIAAIQVFYRDGSSDTIVTDSKWLAQSATRNFYKVNYNDTCWKKAFVAGSTDSSPWHVPAGLYNLKSYSLSLQPVLGWLA